MQRSYEWRNGFGDRAIHSVKCFWKTDPSKYGTPEDRANYVRFAVIDDHKDDKGVIMKPFMWGVVEETPSSPSPNSPIVSTWAFVDFLLTIRLNRKFMSAVLSNPCPWKGHLGIRCLLLKIFRLNINPRTIPVERSHFPLLR